VQPPDEFPQHIFEAAAEFAILAIRTLILVNGAAVIALMTICRAGLGQRPA